MSDRLSRIFSDKVLTIKALSGERLICSAGQVYPLFINYEGFLKYWQLSATVGVATPETTVNVYDTIEEEYLIDVFSNLPGNWSQKWLSQDQIIEFCERYLECWRPEESIAFLAKKDENWQISEENPELNLAVVHMSERNGKLLPGDGWPLQDYRYHAGKRYHRVVVPQILR